MKVEVEANYFLSTLEVLQYKLLLKVVGKIRNFLATAYVLMTTLFWSI